MKNKIFGVFKKSKDIPTFEKDELLSKDNGEELTSTEDEVDVDGIDKEAVIEAILSGNDQKLIELLKGFGVEKEQILALKEQFLSEIKQSMYDEDLQTLNQRFKGLNLTQITDIPNFKKFAALRSEGLGVVEAFTYANPQLFKNK